MKPVERHNYQRRAFVQRFRGGLVRRPQVVAMCRARVKDQFTEDERGGESPEGLERSHQGVLLATGLRVRRRGTADHRLALGAAHRIQPRDRQKYPSARALNEWFGAEWVRKFWGDASRCYYLMVCGAIN